MRSLSYTDSIFLATPSVFQRKSMCVALTVQPLFRIVNSYCILFYDERENV